MCDLNVHEIDLNVLIVHSESIRIGFQEKNQLSFNYKDYPTGSYIYSWVETFEIFFQKYNPFHISQNQRKYKGYEKVNRSKLYKVHFGRCKFRFCYKKPPRKLY